MSNRLSDTFKQNGYSQEEAYFFEENKKKIVELRKFREEKEAKQAQNTSSPSEEKPVKKAG